MLEARVTKCVVVEDNQGRPNVMGVAEYYDHKVNFKAVFDWDTLDKEGFIEDLRDSLAKQFELPVYRVDVRKGQVLRAMAEYSLLQKRWNQGSTLDNPLVISGAA